MHWIVQFLSVALIGMALGSNKTIEKRDESGTLRLRREVRDDGHGNQTREGYETHYYSDGSESSKFHYTADVLDGPWTEWYVGHKIKAQGAYRKGEKDGVELHYLPTGQKIQQVDYKAGHRQGKKIEWSSEGQKTLEADYTDDELNGKLQIWGPDGKPRAVSNYVHGLEEGVQRTWHENGKQLASEIEFHGGQKSGSCRTWFANGQPALQSHYHNGQLVGTVVQWYEDGAKRSEATYVDGGIQGTLTQWFDSPDKPVVSMISNYEHGRINGLQATYYEKSGKKRLESWPEMASGKARGPNGMKTARCARRGPTKTICSKARCGFITKTASNGP